MKFACQLRFTDGLWVGEYTGQDVGPVRVTAPTREGTLHKLEGEIRYRLEICPCTGEAYRQIEIEAVDQ